MAGKIIATGSCLPVQTMTNQDWCQYVDTSDEWIQKRTGINQRHIATTETTVSMASEAAQQALQQAGISGDQLGFIIVATMSPETISPSTACQVQALIGAKHAFCFDINAACTGFVVALATGLRLMANRQYRYGLVIGGETMSRVVDWSDRSTAVLFGDGAGCVLLGQTNATHPTILSEHFQSDGNLADALISGAVCQVDGQRTLKPLTMQGREIFNLVTKEVPKSIQTTLDQAGLAASAIDFYFVHQANARLIKSLQKKFQLTDKQIPINIQHYGNTSAASIPLLMDELVKKGQLDLSQPQKLLFAGYGGGLTWGSLLLDN